MTILNSLDSNRYIVVRDGVEFYYFGLGCIADYFSSTIGYIDELDEVIISFCSGKNKRECVIQNVVKLVSANKSEISVRIDKLFKKGIIVFRDLPHKAELVFHGIKGSYFPKEIAIELTNSCNYKCPFCYKNATSNGKFISNGHVMELEKQIHNNDLGVKT